MNAADSLIVEAAQIVTCAGFSMAPARGADLGRLGLIENGALAIKGGRIAAVGPSAEIRRAFSAPAGQVIDARGKVVMPGFVDPHSHLVFAGDRAAEWEARLQGKAYLQILTEGGGIHATVEATRRASFEELRDAALRRVALAASGGTTTLEAKSGYCLDSEGELKLLEVSRSLAAEQPIEIVSTFLGAHVVPTAYQGRRDDYIELVERTQGEVRRRGLAEFVDVYCEQEAFSLSEAERLLVQAKQLGFGLKLHADQWSSLGATALGLRLGATSIDHLENLAQADLELWASTPSPPVAVLLPGVAFHLGLGRHAPARRLIERSVPIAIATDMNPGTSPTPSMPMVIALACRTFGLSVAEALVAATINAAHALGRGKLTGSLEAGKRADVVVCDLPDYRWLGYAFGYHPAALVFAAGKPIDTRPTTATSS